MTKWFTRNTSAIKNINEAELHSFVIAFELLKYTLGHVYKDWTVVTNTSVFELPKYEVTITMPCVG